MKLKRVLTLITALAIAFTTINLSTFAKVSVNNSGDYKTQLKTLSDLGIVDSHNLSKFGKVTREEFIACVVGLHGIDGAANGIVEYSDLDSTDEYYNSIQYATSFGLVSGDESGQIHPTDEISSYEVAVILLRLLGYGGVGNYEKYASSTSVLCGETEMTWEHVVKILYNLLDKDVVKITYNDDGTAKYEAGEESVLEYYRDIYEFDGILTSVGKTAIDRLTSQPNNQCSIDEDTYDCSKISNPIEYIGYRVQGYYYAPDTDNGQILTILPYNNDVVTIDADDIISYADHTLKYDGANRTKDIKTSINFDVIYNYAADLSFTIDDLYIENGQITAVDNNDDGDYDVLNIIEYKNYIVNSIDTTSGTVYLKYPDGERTTLDLSDSGREVTINNSVGFDADLTDITLNDVLSVYESKEGDYVDATICLDTLDGKINGSRWDDDKQYITIGDTEYRVAEPCLTHQQNELSVGTNGSFILDITGKVAYASRDNSVADNISNVLAYLINIYYDYEADDHIYAKFLMSDNTFMTAQIKDKCSFNFNTYSSVDKLWKAIGGQGLRHRIAMISTSGDGSISSLITEDNSLAQGGFEKFFAKSDGSLHFRTNSALLGDKIAVTGTFPVFIVPDDADEIAERYYSVQNNYFVNDKNYMVDAFRVSDDTYIPSAIVYEEAVLNGKRVTDTDVEINVLDKIGTSVNEDGIAVPMFVMWSRYGKQTYSFEDNELLSTIYVDKDGIKINPKRGDIIRYELRDGAITKLDLLYSAERDAIIDVGGNTNYNKTSNYYNFQVWLKYVQFRFDGFMALVDELPSNYNDFDLTKSDVHNCGGASVICVDTKGNDGVYQGSVDDILGFKNTLGQTASKVIVQERYGDPRVVVVYK